MFYTTIYNLCLHCSISWPFGQSAILQSVLTSHPLTLTSTIFDVEV